MFVFAFLPSCSSYKVESIYGYEGMLGMKVFEDINSLEGLKSEEYNNASASKTKEFTVNGKTFELTYSHSYKSYTGECGDVYIEDGNSDEDAVKVTYTADTDYILGADFPRAEILTDDATEEELKNFVNTFIKERTQFSVDINDWTDISYKPSSSRASRLFAFYYDALNGIYDMTHAADLLISNDKISINVNTGKSNSPLTLEKVTKDFNKLIKKYNKDKRKSYSVESAMQFTANGKIYVRISALEGITHSPDGEMTTEGLNFMMVYAK